MPSPIAIPPDARTVAFVGVAKHAGKTTALRHLLARDMAGGRRAGLVSVGIDGESADKLTGVDKPAVDLPNGHLVVTAADAARASSARFEYLEPLGFETPMGRTLLLDVKEPGEVVLAGIRHRRDLRTAIETLQGAGADRVFVDGAYGRTVAADGRVAEAVLLATGAVAGASATAVAQATRPFVEMLRLSPPAADAHRRAGRRARESGAPVRGTSTGQLDTDTTGTAVDGLDFGAAAATDCVALPGAVTDSVVDALGGLEGDSPTLILPAASHLQVSSDAWRALRRRWEVRVLHPVDLAGVTSNPVHPDGSHLDAEGLVRRLRESFPDLAIEDVVRSHKGGAP